MKEGFNPYAAAVQQRAEAMSLVHARENTAGRVHEIIVFESGKAAQAAGHVDKHGSLG